jgi:hypothetical protein
VADSRPALRPRHALDRRTTALVLTTLLVVGGCSSSGQKGSAFVFLSVDSVSPPGGATSSLADRNTSTVACVTLRNNLKNPTVTLPTGLDTVFLQSYTVQLSRSDGGPVPGPFTFGTSVTVPSGSVSNGAVGGNTAKVAVILVPAQAKTQPPLSSSPTPLSGSATVTFKGHDGRGQNLQVVAGIAVVFVGSGTDVIDACAGGPIGGTAGGTTSWTTSGTTSG